MASHPELSPPQPDNVNAPPRWLRNRWWRWAFLAWGSMMLIGWLGYLAFFGGVPGNYWLAQGYSYLLILAVAIVVTALLTLPVFGLAFGLLAIASIHPPWRSRTRQGAKKLLLMLLIEAMAIAALLPSGILVGYVTDRPHDCPLASHLSRHLRIAPGR
jgi:hypothetical protein